MKIGIPTFTLFALGLAGIAPLAHADLVLDVQTGGIVHGCSFECINGPETFGWAFTVNSTITVDGIGIWDVGSAPLGASTQAGLWTAGGTLLASATISDSSTPVASASADGQWLFENFAAVTLAPGDYDIGNEFFGSGNLNSPGPILYETASYTTIPQITVTGAAQADGFAAPQNDPNDSPFFGPTLEIATPEPEFEGLFVVGIAALLFLRRAKLQSYLHK